MSRRTAGRTRRGLGLWIALGSAAALALALVLLALSTRWSPRSGRSGRAASDADSSARSACTLHVLGSSTALGEPYAPRADLGRITSLLLGDSLAGRPIVVRNHGGKGKPAAGAVDDARAIAALHPVPGSAAALLYLGNNEFLGFDRRHDLRRSERQLFDVAVVSRSDLHQVLQRYRTSLATIVSILQEAGVQVVAATAAVNLADWEPNRSVLAEARHADAVRTGLATGDRLWAQGDVRGALAAYRGVLDLEPEFALAHKRAGDCERELGEVEAARLAYQAAVDFDGNPYRELAAQNAILRQVCAERKVPIIESQALLDAASPSRITGFDLMWDNCHPKLEGYIVLARAGAEALLAAWGADASSLRPLGRQEIEQELGIDAGFMRGVLHERGKYCYAAATLTFDPRARLERARLYLDEADRMGPPDADITCSRAILAALEGDASRSIELWRRAHRLDPRVTRERLSNRYVEQILRRVGVEDLEAKLRAP